jgi:hypothetical protein
MTISEAIDEFLARDREGLDELRSAYPWGEPPLEGKVSFESFRLKNVTHMLLTLMRRVETLEKELAALTPSPPPTQENEG